MRCISLCCNGIHFVLRGGKSKMNEMNLKDDLLNLLGIHKDAQTENETLLQSHFPHHIINGLCTICENKGHCVWVENKKLNCEHYE